MKGRILLQVLLIVGVVYAQNSTKTYRIDRVTDQAKNIVVWTEKTATEAQNIRLVSKPSDRTQASFSNLKTQKGFSLNSSTQLKKSSAEFLSKKPRSLPYIMRIQTPSIRSLTSDMIYLMKPRLY